MGSRAFPSCRTPGNFPMARTLKLHVTIFTSAPTEHCPRHPQSQKSNFLSVAMRWRWPDRTFDQ
eukprot:7063354-Alexandrium_andersonii.AAC.1